MLKSVGISGQSVIAGQGSFNMELRWYREEAFVLKRG